MLVTLPLRTLQRPNPPRGESPKEKKSKKRKKKKRGKKRVGACWPPKLVATAFFKIFQDNQLFSFSTLSLAIPEWPCRLPLCRKDWYLMTAHLSPSWTCRNPDLSSAEVKDGLSIGRALVRNVARARAQILARVIKSRAKRGGSTVARE